MASSGSAIENEIKLRVESPERARSLLQAHGYRVVRQREFEVNDVYDTSDKTFRRRQELVRLRAVSGTTLLTFKAAELPGPHKRREELETEVGDGSAMRAIFERLGLQVSFRYEKYRSEYRRDGDSGTVTIDETPVGCFLEMEGDPEWLDRSAAEMGFSPADYILSSYGTLYLEHCRNIGVTPTHMTFGNTDLSEP